MRKPVVGKDFAERIKEQQSRIDDDLCRGKIRADVVAAVIEF